MKKLSLGAVRTIYFVMLALGLFIAIIGGRFSVTPLCICGMVILMVSNIVRYALYRCPACGEYLGRITNECCPHCGRFIDE